MKRKKQVTIRNWKELEQFFRENNFGFNKIKWIKIWAFGHKGNKLTSIDLEYKLRKVANNEDGENDK